MKNNTRSKKGIMLAAVVICGCLISMSTVSLSLETPTDFGNPIVKTYSKAYTRLIELLYYRAVHGLPLKLLNLPKVSGTLKSFSSYSELGEYLRANGKSGGWGYAMCEDSVMVSSNSVAPQKANIRVSEGSDLSTVSSVEYSTTNVQVEGVDEPDIVKTDGTYLYLLANNKIYIIRAYPAENAEILAEITVEGSSYQSNIFVNGNRLVLLSTSYDYPEYDYYDVWWGGQSTATIKIYDISDRSDPELLNDIEMDGNYFDARMIGNHVYVITTQQSWEICRVEGEEVILNEPEICINGDIQKIPPSDIYYQDVPERMDTMTHILAVDLTTNDVEEKSFLLGTSQTLYVSQNNIYLTYTHYTYHEPEPGEWYGKSEEKTLIHKISINNGDITYIAEGEVPGHVLNQFSMDEHQGFFRIATTVGSLWDHEHPSTNNIYILDDSLTRISSIENIAPGERIYSARFMGGRAYLVTFKKVDPFFTIDLSDPYNPQILGELKIPGYSDYLHPYDENHIIGIGKDTVEALDTQKTRRNLDFAWYQGVKIALFDVTDFENPIEKDKVIIGDRGTSSPVLYNHKALLFNNRKELFVIPVTVYEISEEIKQQNNGYTGSMSGQFTFQGAYVYQITENGFTLRGKISHGNEQSSYGNYYYYGGSSTEITRSLFIDNTLYTLSNSMIKMNDLDTLAEINTLSLN